ncbi:hypothetical protein BB560_003356 [Smittium megazygosporum]|uniref:18S rRNA biogenesis protein RCL1 n=1 Tax=Smittium megazygosporum TaxID=133381 RepID=A0A2T9ZC82_9FUNG|nr:hypothetical protein BB560_003356 [Smittium megazygosporum]
MFSGVKILKFSGHSYFRQRVALSLLSSLPIRIDDIRSDTDSPGLKDFEISLLQIAEKITNGTNIDISTSVVIKPGSLIGGKFYQACAVSRGLGYYLEFIISLAAFTKTTTNATLTGVTNNSLDIGVDRIRTVTLPLLKKFGIETGLELKILKRGAEPLGGGEVSLVFPPVKKINPLVYADPGYISKIRGIAYCTKVPAQTANRLVESARSVLNPYTPDVYIYTDVYKGKDSGNSPGFGILLVAESTTGGLFSSEITGSAGSSAEDIAKHCAAMLLAEIEKGGCVDSFHQWITLLFMTLCSQDVSKTVFGKLNKFTVQYLRDLKTFFNITFKLVPNNQNNTVNVSCVGIGYSNINKSIV